jgi:hypothetical protein
MLSSVVERCAFGLTIVQTGTFAMKREPKPD